MKTTLNYHEQVNINASAGAVGNYVFRANSCYDPNLTGTGHQPLGFDQLAAVYAHYTVTSSRITIKLAPLASETQLVVAGIQLGADATVTGAWTTITEQALTNYTCYGGTLAVGKLPTVKQTFSAVDFFGVKDPNSVREIGALVGSNPADGAFFNIFIQAANLSADPASVDMVVLIEYDVLFSEREEIPSS